VGIAGKWKTEPVLQHHLSAMVIPHILPLAEAPKVDAILKKVISLVHCCFSSFG
jgi:hypothetical protein